MTSDTEELTERLADMKITPETRLELPFLLLEYKRADGDMDVCSNQNRLYSTAAARFLHALGISEIPLFGVTSDGPVVAIPCVQSDKEGVRIPFCVLNQAERAH